MSMARLDHPYRRAGFRPAERSVQPHAGRRPRHRLPCCAMTPDTPYAAPSIGALAWRQTLRDFRAGELRLLALAVMLAVAALTAVGFFADRLNQRPGARCRRAAGRRCRRRQRQAGAGRAAAARRRAGPAHGHQRQLSEHGPRARRTGRRLAAGGGEGGQRRLSAARPVAPEGGARRGRAQRRRRAGARHGVGGRGAARSPAAEARRRPAARRHGLRRSRRSSSSSPTAAPAS